MKKRSNHWARTGEHCPMTGWWSPNAEGQRTMFLSEGTLMPPAKSEPTTWRMLQQPALGTLPAYHPLYDLPGTGRNQNGLA